MVIVIMGVTGSGKTTVGKRLADEVGWRFHDADNFHSAANKAKMHAGHPLSDDDRWPWLLAIRAAIDRDLADGAGVVVACSALRAAYRHALTGGLRDAAFVLLDGDPAILAARLVHRTDHFMNPELLQSQIDTLERPADALIVDIALPVGKQVVSIRQHFHL
jgi:gluconokinase